MTCQLKGKIQSFRFKEKFEFRENAKRFSHLQNWIRVFIKISTYYAQYVEMRRHNGKRKIEREEKEFYCRFEFLRFL